MVAVCTPEDKSHKKQHEAGIALLGKCLREKYGIDLCEECLAREGETGKPYLKDRQDIHFNISHCDGLCCVAVMDSECGIDCEKVREYRENVMRRVFSEKERVQLYSLPEGERNFRFFTLWTLKEAYGKYLGTGIADMKNVSFVFENGQIISDCPQLDFRVYSEGGHIISVCTEKGADPECSFGELIYLC